MYRKNGIELSVVIRLVGGHTFLDRCLRHLIPQTQCRPIEVIVPYDSTVGGLEQIKNDFPTLVFVDMGVIRTCLPPTAHEVAHELYDRRTAAGIRMAQGRIVALLEDYGAPDPDWCEQIIKAHRLPYGIIGGAVEHEGKGSLNWAVYFLDFGRYQLPLREGPSDYATDVNVSYKREILEDVKHLWRDRYNEVTVHWALAKKGVILWRKPQIVVRQDRGKLSFSQLIRERFNWGRLFACMRKKEMSSLSRFSYIVMSPGIPAVLLARMASKVFGVGGRNRTRFVLSFPQVVAMTICWCLGEFAGYVTGRESLR